MEENQGEWGTVLSEICEVIDEIQKYTGVKTMPILRTAPASRAPG
jgi:hypothetical protein